MAVGALSFEVVVGHEDDVVVIERLFQDLPRSDVVEALARFEMMRSESSNASGDHEWTLKGPRIDDGTSVSFVGALQRLISAVNLSALDAEPNSLHIHAAAAARDGLAVVIAAERNTGKTTAVSHLVERGWSFITDETVRLTPESPAVSGFPKPLSIKPGGLPLVGRFADYAIPAAVDDRPSYAFIPVGATGAALVPSATPRLTVLLRRDHAHVEMYEPVARRLSPADAVVALMQETLDAERYGDAVLRLAHLAAKTSCYEVTVGSPELTADLVEQLFAEPASPDVEVVEFPFSANIADGVVSVQVGDAVVVHEQRNGGVFALDAAGARVWRHVGGWTVDEAIDVDGPMVAPFVRQLRSLGVLVGAS